MAKVQMLNEPVASGTAPIASSCPFSVTKKGMVDTCCSTMMPAIEVLVDTKEKVELGLKMGDKRHYEGVDAQHIRLEYLYRFYPSRTNREGHSSRYRSL